ncbi:cytochrome b [Pelagibacterium lacus]|nr:cytochrome b/b6 domain-containing protein [Pelagibacterium lacus]
MPLKSTSSRYGTVAIGLHWVTAILIVALLALGLNAADAETDALRRTLLIPHIGLGLLVFALTLFRIGWWVLADKKPAPLASVPALQNHLATAVHVLSYAAILALAASGIATNVMAGVIDALSTGAPIPAMDGVPPRAAHGLLARLFMVLLVLHIGAALYHQFFLRDSLLARMGIGKLKD